MFGLDPLSRPVAITEMLLLLALAAFVGWLLGRLVLNGRINALRADIADKEAELSDCHAAKAGVAPAPAKTVSAPPTYVTPRPEPVVEPVAHVPADPLLPAFSHDDTPDLVTTPTSRLAEVPNHAANGLEEVALRTEKPIEVSAIPDMTAPVLAMTSTLPASGTAIPTTSEAAVLNRIAARASEVNFDRIGRATAAEADDLKDIVGIGPFLERKLHSLGIYTFRQVANFTKEDVDKVNSIIEFFPGRIERDNWVDQSQAFHERKYGVRS